MSDELGRAKRGGVRRNLRRILKRPLSLAVVGATLIGSLLLVERSDTGATLEAELAARQGRVDSGVSVQSHRPRPDTPIVDVAGAIEAGEYAAADARAAIARVQGGDTEGREDQACAFLLEARARFILRIDFLIGEVPDAEDELLEIRAEVLAEIDAELALLDCPISP